MARAHDQEVTLEMVAPNAGMAVHAKGSTSQHVPDWMQMARRGLRPEEPRVLVGVQLVPSCAYASSEVVGSRRGSDRMDRGPPLPDSGVAAGG